MQSLKKRFQLSFLLLILGFVVLFLHGNYSKERSLYFNEALNTLNVIEIELLNMRRAEKDFFLRHDAKYIHKFNLLGKSISKNIENLNSFRGLFTFSEKMKVKLETYKELFFKIAQLKKVIGLSEADALRKDLRNKAHALERSLSHEKSLALKVLLLQLRRSEKDFFLRLQQKYLDKHESYYADLKSMKLSVSQRKLFFEYKKLFLEVVNTMKMIGLNEKSAMRGEMRALTHQVESFFQVEHERLIVIVKEELEKITIEGNFFQAILIVLAIGVLFFIIRPIDKDFKIFESFLDNFSQKNQHFELSRLRFTEITKIAQTLNETLQKQERTQDELREALEASQQLQKVKEEFLGNMSHELRTPLNGIIGFSKILQKKLPEHALEIDPIVDSSHNLLSLVNDILDFSKIQSGHFTLSHDIFCLSQKLEPFLQQFQVKIQEKEIDFTFESQGIEELYIDADWLRISQILSNILSNAIKFTPENGLISMDVFYENDSLQIKIKDNGIGISKEALEHIFDPFRQADSSTTKNYGGTGLGLSIAAALADLMNGDIVIDSEENKGSMFTVTLKVLQAEKVQHEDEALVEETLQKLQAHILVAEDNKTNQLLMGMILEELGLSYDMANDGLEAVEMYGKESYDLVLMDENMPNMNGVDAMQKIHELYKDVVPILAVTANVMKGDEARLLEAGMDGFIPKPIDSKELLHKMQFFLKTP